MGGAEAAPGPAGRNVPGRGGVIDGPKISCLDARLRDVLRDRYEVELLVCDAGHLWVVASGG
jgi:hypothetical protein